MPFMKEEMKKKDTAIMEDMEKEIEQAQQELAKETEVKAEPDSIKETAEQAAEALLQAEIDKKDAELQEVNDRLMRLRADFDNFRRRTRQEKEELSAVVLQNFMFYSLILALGGDIGALYMLLLSVLLSGLVFAILIKRLPSSSMAMNACSGPGLLMPSFSLMRTAKSR